MNRRAFLKSLGVALGTVAAAAAGAKLLDSLAAPTKDSRRPYTREELQKTGLTWPCNNSFRTDGPTPMHPGHWVDLGRGGFMVWSGYEWKSIGDTVRYRQPPSFRVGGVESLA